MLSAALFLLLAPQQPPQALVKNLHETDAWVLFLDKQ